MLKYFVLFSCFLTIPNAFADNVILMIGDGMGNRHIECVGRDNNLFLKTLLPQVQLHTSSADNAITDSAAAATAYSCGIKTNNGYLGMDAQQKNCRTIAEDAVEQGKDVYILSTDMDTGATPSAFYAHVNSRYNHEKILEYKKQASEKMYISLNETSINSAVAELLEKLKNSSTSYFVMIEEAYIDKCSHNNDYKCMEQALKNFDEAVRLVYEFAGNRDDVHVFVTADHETGGLSQNCEYTTGNHTLLDVSLFAKTNSFFYKNEMENNELYDLMKEVFR